MSMRDIPTSFDELAFGWARKVKNEISLSGKANSTGEEEKTAESKGEKKVRLKNLWAAFCSGAGLFSDGYVNNSIGTVSTCLSIMYPEEYLKSNAMSNVSSIAFAGTVVGMLVFGLISDRIDRKAGMLSANIMLIFFIILSCAATWGKNGSPYGIFAALTTFRFFLGIAIGAEYPTSSVIAAEFSNLLPAGKRNRYFCWFTNAMIDVGFVVSAFVPLVCLWIFSTRHLEAVWRLTLGLGAIPPISLFFLRLKINQSESFKKMHMKKVKKFPYLLIFKFYWFRLFIISIIWFIYDFSAYSFGIYSSYIINTIVPGGDLYKNFGWNVVFNLFYLPGAFLGALVSDYLGPRLTIAVGTFLQGIIGFVMAGEYPHLKHNIGGFVVVYGIFSALGELGAGDNMGLLASKTSSSSIRGVYYGIAAAMGKIGAFVGTWVFPVIIDNNGGKKSNAGMQAPFYVSSSLCFFSCFLTLFFCPSVDQDAINTEDEKFLTYLKENGFDISQLGDCSSTEDLESDKSQEKEKDTKVKVDTESKSSF